MMQKLLLLKLHDLIIWSHCLYSLTDQKCVKSTCYTNCVKKQRLNVQNCVQSFATIMLLEIQWYVTICIDVKLIIAVP